MDSPYQNIPAIFYVPEGYITNSEKLMASPLLDTTVLRRMLLKIDETGKCSLRDLIAVFSDQTRGSTTRAVALFQKLGLISLASE